MKPRPTSVTVIAWLLMVGSVISLVGMGFSISSQIKEFMSPLPMQIWAQFVLGFAGIIIALISAIFMLQGANWARWLYTVWSAFGFIIAMLTFPSYALTVPGLLAMLPGFLVYVIIVTFLFLPKSTAYFTYMPVVPIA